MSTSTEVALLTALNQLAVGGPGTAIQKTGPNSFGNISIGNFVQKTGDTMLGALVMADHEATGLVPQASNIMWGAIGHRPATAPIGTRYYVIPS